MDVLKEILYVSNSEVALSDGIACFTFKDTVFDSAGRLVCQTLWLLFLPE